MNATTVAVDLAKNVFELAVADTEWRIVERHRLNRARFARFFVHRAPCQVIMEACGSAHHWARRLVAEGHTVRLLPAHYVKPYVGRSKTDRADAAALIEAARLSEQREQHLAAICDNRSCVLTDGLTEIVVRQTDDNDHGQHENQCRKPQRSSQRWPNVSYPESHHPEA